MYTWLYGFSWTGYGFYIQVEGGGGGVACLCRNIAEDELGSHPG